MLYSRGMGKHRAAFLFLVVLLFLALPFFAARAQTPAPTPPAATPSPTLTPTPTVPEVAALCFGGLDKCFGPAKDNYGWQFAFLLLVLFFLAAVAVSILYDKTKGALLRLWDRLASRLRFARDPARYYLRNFISDFEDPSTSPSPATTCASPSWRRFIFRLIYAPMR